MTFTTVYKSKIANVPPSNFLVKSLNTNSKYVLRIEKPILKKISELELNLSTNVAEFQTFTLDFVYNKFHIINEID